MTKQAKKERRKKEKKQLKVSALFVITIMIAAQISFMIMLSQEAKGQESLGGSVLGGSDAIDETTTALSKAEEKYIEKLWGKLKMGKLAMIFSLISRSYTLMMGFHFISMGKGKGGEWRLTGTCSKEPSLGGTDKCRSCNEDPYRICTKERCEKLGSCIAAATIEKHPELPIEYKTTLERENNVLCLPGKCEEKGYVIVKNIKAEWTDKTAPKTAEASKGELEITDELPYDIEEITLSIETDLNAKCSYMIDKADSKFEDMESFENNLDFPKSQSIKVALGKVEEIGNSYVNIARGEEHTIYIKCNSLCNVAHEPEFKAYYVKFKLGQKPETEPPVIWPIDPSPTMFISSEYKEIRVELWLDEDGYCKYSTGLENWTEEWNATGTETTMILMTADKTPHPNYPDNVSVKYAWCRSYQQCPGPVKANNCTHCYLDLDLTRGYDEVDWTALSEMESYKPEGEEEVKLTGEEKEDIKGLSKMFMFNFKCADLGFNKAREPTGLGDDNVMEEIYEYAITTISPYDITIVKPADEERVDEKYIPIEVNTSRPAVCKYSVDEDLGWFDSALIEGGNEYVHTAEVKNLTSTASGMKHTLYLICRDKVNLELKTSRVFYVKEDISAPIITRAYHTPDVRDFLTITTNEEAVCEYNVKSTPGCNFEFGQGTLMMGDENGVEHVADWATSRTYYIKCKDWKGNLPPTGSCTMIVHPYSVVVAE